MLKARHLFQNFKNESTDVISNFLSRLLNKNDNIHKKEVQQSGGSFATFAYSVIPELSCHLRPMVRKGKSLLFEHISRIFKKTAVQQPLPAKTAIFRQKKKIAAKFF